MRDERQYDRVPPPADAGAEALCEYGRHLALDGILALALEEAALKNGRSLARVRRSGTGARRAGMRRTAWLSVAACLAVVAGALLVNEWRSRRMPERIEMKLAQAGDSVRVVRDGRNVAVAVGMELLRGDTVRTGRDHRARVEYGGDASSVEVLADTEAVFFEENGARRIDLRAGTITCDIVARSGGSELVLVTADARAEVKGTRFRLYAGPAPGEDAESLHRVTRIDVHQGLVTFTRLSDGESVDVGTKHFAVAGKGIRLEAVSTLGAGLYAGRRDDGPVTKADIVRHTEGPVLLLEDFESGFTSWYPYVWGSYDATAPVTREGRDEARNFVVTRAVDRGGRVTHVASVGPTPEGTPFTLGLRRAGGETETAAYSIEYDRFIVAPPGGRVPAGVAADEVGCWTKWRIESVRVGMQGNDPVLHVRISKNGTLVEETTAPDGASRDCKRTFQLRTPDTSLQVWYDNIVIREMAPAAGRNE